MRHQSRQQFRSMFQVKVSNSRNGSLIGYVGDVSESGFKIVSESPFVRDEHLHVLMQVREGEIAQYDLDATCKWSANNVDTGYFEGGFRLHQPPAKFVSMVERLRDRRDKTEKSKAEKTKAVKDKTEQDERANSPSASMSA